MEILTAYLNTKSKFILDSNKYGEHNLKSNIEILASKSIFLSISDLFVWDSKFNG